MILNLLRILRLMSQLISPAWLSREEGVRLEHGLVLAGTDTRSEAEGKAKRNLEDKEAKGTPTTFVANMMCRNFLASIQCCVQGYARSFRWHMLSTVHTQGV